MLSKLVAEREKSTRGLLAAFETHKSLIVHQLHSFLRHGNPDASDLADVSKLLEQIQHSLQQACQTMIEADAQHNRELKDDFLLRDARDAAKESVTQMVKTIAFAISVSHGPDISKRLTSSRSAPTTPNQVLSWGKKFYDTLSKLSLPAKSLNVGSDEMGEFSIEIALSKLEQRLNDLELALKELALEARQAEQTLAVKDAALREHDRSAVLAYRILEAVMRYAGQEDLALKVRPKARKSSSSSKSKSPSSNESMPNA